MNGVFELTVENNEATRAWINMLEDNLLAFALKPVGVPGMLMGMEDLVISAFSACYEKSDEIRLKFIVQDEHSYIVKTTAQG